MSEHPQNVVQATGAVASDVVLGLKNNPALLSVVVLNVLAILAAVWFLRGLVEDARENRARLLAIVEKCIHQPTAAKGTTKLTDRLEPAK